MHRLTYGFVFKLFVVLYLLAGLVSFSTLDFCGDHASLVSLLASCLVYVLASVLTLTQYFDKTRSFDRITFFLVFWALNFGVCLFCTLVSFDIEILLIILIAPSWGILDMGSPYEYVFILVSFLETIMMLLLRGKYKNLLRR